MRTDLRRLANKGDVAMSDRAFAFGDKVAGFFQKDMRGGAFPFRF